MILRDEDSAEISRKLEELQGRLEELLGQPITTELKVRVAVLCREVLKWCISKGYSGGETDDNVLVLHDPPERMKYTISIGRPETLYPSGDFNSLDIAWPAWFKKILEEME
jgi:hypothetical protein